MGLLVTLLEYPPVTHNKDSVMERLQEISSVFVDQIPGDLEHGKLYICERYEVCVHLCACGCGVKTVTPLGTHANGPEWTLNKLGDTISLTPSIGNFMGEKPYHAHYNITKNKIVWHHE